VSTAVPLSGSLPRGFPPRPRSRETIREWDRRAVEEVGIPGIVLMENAGRGAANIVFDLSQRARERFPAPFHVFSGPGNNGGDGFVVARHLHNMGLPVSTFALEGTEYAPGSEAARNLEILRRMGLGPVFLPYAEIPRAVRALLASGTTIDALFGTGLSRPLRAPYTEWIEAINESGRVVVAMDVPSGLDANTGEVLGAAVRAEVTVTFAAPKLGFELGRGPELCGAVHVVDIGLPREFWEDPSS